MTPGLQYVKTAAGQAEISRRSDRLSRPLRNVLLCVDGQRDAAALQALIGAIGAPPDALEQLLALGLIGSVTSEALAVETAPPPTEPGPVPEVAAREVPGPSAPDDEPAAIEPDALPEPAAAVRLAAEARRPEPASLGGEAAAPDVQPEGASEPEPPAASVAAGPSAGEMVAPAPSPLERLDYPTLYRGLNALVADNLGMIKGVRLQLSIEQCSTVEQLRALIPVVAEALAARHGKGRAADLVAQLADAAVLR
jgi:hypothetical protein